MDLLFSRILGLGVVYLGALGIIILIWKIIESRKKVTTVDTRKYVLLEILVPKHNDRGPLSAENLYASFHGIFDPNSLIQEQISLEVISKNQAIKFFVRTPVSSC